MRRGLDTWMSRGRFGTNFLSRAHFVLCLSNHSRKTNSKLGRKFRIGGIGTSKKVRSSVPWSRCTVSEILTTPTHFLSYHTSPHLTSPHLASPRLTSPHLTTSDHSPARPSPPRYLISYSTSFLPTCKSGDHRCHSCRDCRRLSRRHLRRRRCCRWWQRRCLLLFSRRKPRCTRRGRVRLPCPQLSTHCIPQHASGSAIDCS